MHILGIETSCDDTSAAVVIDGVQILSNVVSSQNEFHAAFAGVVPEIASRKHIENILPVIDKALHDAGTVLDDIDAIAVTEAPGLIGSLLIGMNTAKALAMRLQKPLIPVNHLVAHMYALNLSNQINYPYIGLLVSGGHTMLCLMRDPVTMTMLGTTIDDACGEAFDKIAKHFNLGYPGGPVIDRLSAEGRDDAIRYPIVMLDESDNPFNFSYSGLKTAVVYQTEKYLADPSQKPSIPDICASFQKAALTVLLKKACRACRDYDIAGIGIAGGVSANRCLRRMLESEKEITPYLPPINLCTDNAAMIAGVAYHMQHKVLSGSALYKLVPRTRSTITDGIVS